MSFLAHHSYSSQLRLTVYPSLCAVLTFIVVFPRSPLVFLFRFIFLLCISCVIPRVSQHPLWALFRCFPLTVCHSHILRRRSPVSGPFHLTVPDFPCAIPRVLQHLLCHFSFSPPIFFLIVPPLFYFHFIYCFSYLTASPCRLPLAMCLSHIPFISFHMREMLHA